MKPVLRVQLSLMMFLEYFIKGAWFVTLGTYLIKSLNASGMEVSNIFATQSLGAVFAPFFVGFVADRYFNAERVLSALHLIGAGLLYGMLIGFWVAGAVSDYLKTAYAAQFWEYLWFIPAGISGFCLVLFALFF